MACNRAFSRTCPSVKVNIFEVEGVDVAGYVSEDRQADIDEEVGAAACDHEHANGREE